MTSIRRRTTIALSIAGALIFSACGGDDAGGAGGNALSDEAFCARVAELETESEQLSPDEADAAFFDSLGSLASAAPNAEVRDALDRLGEIAQRLDGLDENDPDAFAAAFAIMFDPGFLAAMETLERYMIDVCGYDESDFDGDFDGDFDDDFDFEADGSFEFGDSYGDGTLDGVSPDFDGLFEALQSSDLIRGPLGLMTGMADPESGTPLVVVSVEPSENPDLLAVCEEVAQILDSNTGVEGLAIRIDDPMGQEIYAVRPARGNCSLG